MQLHLRFFWSFAEPHEDAQWGKAFQVQQVRQSIQRQTSPHKTFQNSHDLDNIDSDKNVINQVQQMQQSSQGKEKSHRTFHNSHDLDSDVRF